MALELKKCIAEYITASILFIPRQKFIELRGDMEGLLIELNNQEPLPTSDQVEKILNRIMEKNRDDFNTELAEITDNTPIHPTDNIVQQIKDAVKIAVEDIANSTSIDQIKQDYGIPMDAELEIVNSANIDKIKQALNSHPLMGLTENQIKKYFGRQKYLLSDSNSFDPFGEAIYTLLTQSAEFLSPSSLFSLGDFLDISGLLGKLKNDSNTNTKPVSQFFWSMVDTATKQALNNLDLNAEELKCSLTLAKAFNKILQGNSIFDPIRFDKIELRPITQSIKNTKPTGVSLTYLNRLLIEDVYEKEIAKIVFAENDLENGQITLWDWISKVHGWIVEQHTWQQEITNKIASWELNPNNSLEELINSLQKLKSSLVNVKSPSIPPLDFPVNLKGKII